MSDLPPEADPAAEASRPDPERWDPPEGGGGLERIASLVRYLRARCPWDGRQTAESLIPYFLEEAHEVVEAVEDDEPEVLREELGDLLLHLAFQVVLAEEDDRFGAAGVVAAVEEKMKRRHPHLFGRGGRPDGWEELKARERGDEPALDGLARRLDPLLRAHRVGERAGGVGFDWDDAGGAWEKAAEELEEVRTALADGDDERVEEELGDLLLAVVHLTRLAGGHARLLLHRANRKFERRFRRLEERAREAGIDLREASLDELDALWDEVKGA